MGVRRVGVQIGRWDPWGRRNPEGEEWRRSPEEEEGSGGGGGGEEESDGGGGIRTVRRDPEGVEGRRGPERKEGSGGEVKGSQEPLRARIISEGTTGFHWTGMDEVDVRPGVRRTPDRGNVSVFP